MIAFKAELWAKEKRDKFFANLRNKYAPKYKEKHEQRELMLRLLNNPDFIAWQSGLLDPVIEGLKARIMSTQTTGFQHDYLKSLLLVFETMRLAGVQEAVVRLDREMKNIAGTYIRKGGSDGD